MSRRHASNRCLPNGLIRRAGMFARAERGVVAIITALALPVLVGFVGLGVEVGLWYLNARALQSSADMGAYAGALEARRGSGDAAIRTVARAESERNGVVVGRDSVTVNIPPLTGAYTASPEAVEVIVSSPQDMMFSALFLGDALSINARAVAVRRQTDEACVLALNPNAGGALTFQGNAAVTMSGCSVMANSTAAGALGVNGNPDVTADCAMASGTVDDPRGNIVTPGCSGPMDRVPPSADPYADVDRGALPSCHDPDGDGSPDAVSLSGPSSSFNLSPGRYCDGFHLRSGTVNLAPGVYYIDGGELRINAQAAVTGTGVTFVLTDAYDGAAPDVTINGGAAIDLTAPSTGAFAGLVFYYDRDVPAGAAVRLNGNSATDFTGALYFPNQSVTFNGNNATGGGCTHIIADTISFSGSARLSNDCGAVNTRVIATAGDVRIVE